MPAKKAAARKIKADDSNKVLLRLPGQEPHQIECGRELQRIAMHLSYVASNRRRWSATDRAQQELYRESESHLKTLGIGRSDIKKIADAELVEVSIPWTGSEETCWEARILPWEFLLSSATSSYRSGRPFLVIRHLNRLGQPVPARRDIRHPLAIESSPKPFDEYYSFTPELNLLRSHLDLDFDRLSNPTLARLKKHIRRLNPAVIHLAGLDTHQGIRLLTTAGFDQWFAAQGEDKERDGMFLPGEDGLPAAIESEELARAINCAAHPPMLVSCNFFNSAARTASLIVAHGAHAAIGFQDDIDEALAENFFATFYYLWRQPDYDWNLLKAMQGTWRVLKGDGNQNRMKGTGVVLWSAQPLLDDQIKPAADPTDPAERLLELRREAEKTPVNPRDLDVEIYARDKVNYSLLHNNRGLFSSFRLRHHNQRPVSDVEVSVKLYAGSDELPYVKTFTLEEPVIDLADKVRVPLTAQLARSLRESVRTILSVKVAAGAHTLYQDTHRVTLLPIDEWKDDDLERYWLPSFVLPRDPAVARIIDSAQRYVMAIKDDPTAGFDGYQSDVEGFKGIDRQVQALWSAITFDHPLSYINPPPSFTEFSQRLRTPSAVINGRRGTCIDLALLLAACLEYVDIYPVIFLLNNHAFPGYWRSEESYEKFLQVAEGATGNDKPAQAMKGLPDGQVSPWTLPPVAWREIKKLVDGGDLVPLESVGLTQHISFRQAQEEGLSHLEPRKRDNFNSLIDVKLARQWDVTPLPISLRED